MECLVCGKLLTGYQRKFCSRSCSASHNNMNRTPRTEESKLRTALSVCKTLGVEYRGKRIQVDRVKVERSLKFIRIRNIWHQMKYRCHSNHHPDYRFYGAKGICVCDEWMTFDNFYNDMESTWFVGATIDRINNEKGYYKDNCQWLTHYDNATKKKIRL